MAPLTFHWSVDITIVVITAIIGLYVYMTRNFGYWKKRGVVEIPPVPFFGNFASVIRMKKAPGDLIEDLYKAAPNEPYVGFYIYDQPQLLVRDPELVKHVLLRDFNAFYDRAVTAHDPVSAPNIFFINNPAWKLVRTKLTPIFTSGKLKNMFQLMLRVGENLKTHLNSIDLDKGEVVDIKKICAKYAIDVVGITAFGLDVNALSNPDSEFLNTSLEIFRFTTWRGMEVSSLFFAPGLIKPMGFRFLSRRVSNFVRRVFWDTAAERERTGLRRNDLVDRLMDIKKSEADSANKKIFDFDGDNLVAQAALFFNAGYDTISSTVSFSLYELALAPNLQTKLRREIKEALENNNDVIDYDLVMTCSYLDMVVSETLRKYPSLPFLDRVANTDYKVPNSDLILEKGMRVYISLLGLHYDPQYWPNPEVFDPERFTEENKRNRKPYVYLPFGEGPRNCIGMRFALLEAKLAIIQIISEYVVSPCEKTLIPMKFDPKAVVLGAHGGLYLKIRKITDADD